MIVDEARVQARLLALADQLTAAGQLRSPGWRKALLTVRRHVFVPRYWQDCDPGSDPPRWRMVDNATADHDEWFDAVYSDQSLPTELLGTPRSDGHGMHPLVTSSTTMPSLVIAMLEALDIDTPSTPENAGAVARVDAPSVESDQPEHRVLEIGTATGYNAALLCERLGDTNVTTIEISPELAALARVRLAEHGYHPHVVAGDGATGVPARAPYDRIIATCGLDHVPPAWLAQTRPGGKILLNLVGPFHHFALLLLTVADDGTATGGYLQQSGGFTQRRTDPHRPFDPRTPITRPATPARITATDLDPRELWTDTTWGLHVQTTNPDMLAQQVYLDTHPSPHPVAQEDQPGEPPLATELGTRDGSSWAQIHHDPRPDGRHTVVQAGTRNLRSELEALQEAHRAAWRDPQEWIVTVSHGGEIAIRLDRGSPARAGNRGRVGR